LCVEEKGRVTRERAFTRFRLKTRELSDRHYTPALALTYFNYSQTSHIVHDYPVLKRITDVKEL